MYIYFLPEPKSIGPVGRQMPGRRGCGLQLGVRFDPVVYLHKTVRFGWCPSQCGSPSGMGIIKKAVVKIKIISE